MKKVKKKEIINLSLIDNSDYFFRDQEMFRADISLPNHESEYENKINKSVLNKKKKK